MKKTIFKHAFVLAVILLVSACGTGLNAPTPDDNPTDLGFITSLQILSSDIQQVSGGTEVTFSATSDQVEGLTGGAVIFMACYNNAASIDFAVVQEAFNIFHSDITAVTADVSAQNKAFGTAPFTISTANSIYAPSNGTTCIAPNSATSYCTRSAGAGCFSQSLLAGSNTVTVAGGLVAGSNIAVYVADYRGTSESTAATAIVGSGVFNATAARTITFTQALDGPGMGFVQFGDVMIFSGDYLFSADDDKIGVFELTNGLYSLKTTIDINLMFPADLGFDIRSMTMIDPDGDGVKDMLAVDIHGVFDLAWSNRVVFIPNPTAQGALVTTYQYAIKNDTNDNGFGFFIDLLRIGENNYFIASDNEITVGVIGGGVHVIPFGDITAVAMLDITDQIYAHILGTADACGAGEFVLMGEYIVADKCLNLNASRSYQVVSLSISDVGAVISLNEVSSVSADYPDTYTGNSVRLSAFENKLYMRAIATANQRTDMFVYTLSDGVFSLSDSYQWGDAAAIIEGNHIGEFIGLGYRNNWSVALVHGEGNVVAGAFTDAFDSVYDNFSGALGATAIQYSALFGAMTVTAANNMAMSDSGIIAQVDVPTRFVSISVP
ncbi:MAG: hypothetical protein ABIE74_06775 [Pseudomonadota bacterium]